MIDVFTPTIRHEGIRIIADCLERQIYKDFRWIIVDHDYNINWFTKNIPFSLWRKTLYLRPKIQRPERKYKLWNTRNTGYQFLERPLVVEIQDYHWFRSDTLIRLATAFEKNQKSIVSAYYKIVTFKNFESAHRRDNIDDIDLEIIDETARAHVQNKIVHGGYTMYEMNVSSMPLEFLLRHTPVDEDMDNGYLIDTHYFSIPAVHEKYDILIDGEAKVYSFEHKLFEKRPDGWRTDGERNQAFLKEKYKNIFPERNI